MWKNFNSNLEHQTLGDVVIISKKAAKYNLGNIYYALKYDPKLMNKFLKKCLKHNALFFFFSNKFIQLVKVERY